ncbi:DUF3558 family protein [Pseudonocardia nematodicida]|uniref:DUF3558 family protein n=1 Tax=Pseudonocardia nematodicida TaxID=1206997 RepID=A0ABV1KFM3_9PSEU
MRVRIRLVAIVVGLTGLAGCATSSAFPERPYVLDVDLVDPCAALTDTQRETFGLRPGSVGTAQGGTSRACAWMGVNGVGFTFQTLASEAAVAIDAEPTSAIVTVAGFGGVQSSPPAEGTGLPFCQVVIDVADEASVRTQMQVTPVAPDADQRTVEDTCTQVRDVAAMMLDTLHSQQS